MIYHTDAYTITHSLHLNVLFWQFTLLYNTLSITPDEYLNINDKCGLFI